MFNRIANFMVGRNGMDALNVGMLVAAVVLSAIGVFVVTQAAYNVLRVLSTALLVLAVLRMLSRRLEARQRENAKFLTLTAGLRTRAANLTTRVSGDRDHKYFTCPSCRNRLRVPAGKGKIEITCPKCGTRFAGKS